ncbi:MAG: alpha/beta fold hydrolase [Planctomycetota bacterium]
MLTTATLLAALTGFAPLPTPALAAPSPAAVVAAPAAVKDMVLPALISTGDKLELRGDYFPPRSPSGRAPALLLLHDAGSDRSSMTTLAEAYQRAGFGVLAIDLRAHGQSATEDLDWTAADDEAKRNLWARAMRDVEAGADWLSDQDGLHSSNLTVVGVGASGALAVRHALRDDNVRGVGMIGLETNAFGFDLAEDLVDLEGLPVIVSAAKGERDAAEGLVASLNADDWITVKPQRGERSELLDDKRAVKAMVDWAEELAMPKRGGRR